MGQIKINGFAIKEFKADIMTVSISVSAKGETAAIAVKKGKKETEKILQLLVDIGLDLSKVKMKKDKVSEPNRYDGDLYTYEKDISFSTETNLSILELVSNGIVNREINAAYTEFFSLSYIQEAQKEVLQEALLNSEKKAKAIAEALGQKIIGIESAKCNKYDDEDEVLMPHAMSVRDYCDSSLEVQLSPDTVNIERSIDVAWLVE